MTKHYCDRCAEETTKEKVSSLSVVDGINAGTLEYIDLLHGRYQIELDTFSLAFRMELCSACRGELQEWRLPIRRRSYAQS